MSDTYTILMLCCSSLFFSCDVYTGYLPFLELGANASHFTHVDDKSTKAIPLPSPFYFGKLAQSQVYVSQWRKNTACGYICCMLIAESVLFSPAPHLLRHYMLFFLFSLCSFLTMATSLSVVNPSTTTLAKTLLTLASFSLVRTGTMLTSPNGARSLTS